FPCLFHEVVSDVQCFPPAVDVALNNTCVSTNPHTLNVFISMEGSKLGGGVYQIASFFNHSCEPNACQRAGLCDDRKHAFNSIVVRATKKIRAGEQIFISYIYADHPYDFRQRELARFGFWCSCGKCEREKPRK